MYTPRNNVPPLVLCWVRNSESLMGLFYEEFIWFSLKLLGREVGLSQGLRARGRIRIILHLFVYFICSTTPAASFPPCRCSSLIPRNNIPIFSPIQPHAPSITPHPHTNAPTHHSLTPLDSPHNHTPPPTTSYSGTHPTHTVSPSSIPRPAWAFVPAWRGYPQLPRGGGSREQVAGRKGLHQNC